MGEVLARTAAGLELLRGSNSRPQTDRALEMTWTEKKPESSMLVEGCSRNCLYSGVSSPISAILSFSRVSSSEAMSARSTAE